jgi:hypothetical protein
LSPFRQHIEARARRQHVADMPPLVRAVYHHRYAQRMRADAGPWSSIPEQRESHEFWMEEADAAQARRDRILAGLRKLRDDIPVNTERYSNNEAA